jgi:O-antigen/teichoic acid export membrane protein
MLFFSIVEVINKILGVYITGYTARVLSPTALGQYFSGLVILNYALEISFFGAQNKHNADFAARSDYLSSREFAGRKALTVATCVAACAFLLATLRSVADIFDVVPLALILAYVPITYDYVAYGTKNSYLIVLARLLSQLAALGWTFMVAHDYIHARELFWGSFLQTTILTLVVLVGLVWTKRLTTANLRIGVTSFPITSSDVLRAFSSQGAAFLLRIAGLAVVSGELLYLSVVGNDLSGGLATSLRFVQVIFPFVVFYVDSRVAALSEEAFEQYARVIAALSAAFLALSPLCVLVLYGRAYANDVATINQFLPAFVVQSMLQFSTLLFLKRGTERALLRSLAVPIAVTVVGLTLLHFIGLTLHRLAVLYSIKAAVFVVVLPQLSKKTKLAAGVALALILIFNPVLDRLGYFSSVTAQVSRITGTH